MSDSPIDPDSRSLLRRQGDAATRQHNESYTTFVRWARLLLPLLALMIIGLIFAWPNMNSEPIVNAALDTQLPDTVGRNEMIAPVFESQDTKGQPFEITATRAIQGEEDENLVVLEEPTGRIMLDGDDGVDLRADTGAYRQDVQRIFLEGHVDLNYEAKAQGDAYNLKTRTLHLDMRSSEAWSDDDVVVRGPQGDVVAKGLEIRNQDGVLIFKGPATLTLNENLPGL